MGLTGFSGEGGGYVEVCKPNFFCPVNYDYRKRGYLLPKGCKDLIDAWKPKVQTEPTRKPTAYMPKQALSPGAEILIPNPVTPFHLAELLGLKPFVIIADLMTLNVFAAVNQSLDRLTAGKVVRLHGCIPKNDN